MGELILYAVPTGELAEQLDDLFASFDTVAQRYPPHCTLTGFFHDDDIARYVDAAARASEPVVVDVTGPHAGDDAWIGLEVHSSGLERVTARFADAVAEPRTRLDALRRKQWLHVSLAYGHDPALHAALLARCEAAIDSTARGGWELRLYERGAGDTWTVHGSWPLDPS